MNVCFYAVVFSTKYRPFFYWVEDDPGIEKARSNYHFVVKSP